MHCGSPVKLCHLEQWNDCHRCNAVRLACQRSWFRLHRPDSRLLGQSAGCTNAAFGVPASLPEQEYSPFLEREQKKLPETANHSKWNHVKEKWTVRSNNAVVIFCFSAFSSLDPAKSKIALPSGCQLLHPRDGIQTSGNAVIRIHIEAGEAHLRKQQQPHFHCLCEVADGNCCFLVFFVNQKICKKMWTVFLGLHGSFLSIFGKNRNISSASNYFHKNRHDF